MGSPMKSNKIQFSIGIDSNPNSKRMYNALNARIERMSRVIYFILVKVSMIGIVLPALLITAINFWFLDLGDESFFVPSQVMYVLKMSSFSSAVF